MARRRDREGFSWKTSCASMGTGKMTLCRVQESYIISQEHWPMMEISKRTDSTVSASSSMKSPNHWHKVTASKISPISNNTGSVMKVYDKLFRVLLERP